jgi:starvation-inducible DNA-binding protein
MSNARLLSYGPLTSEQRESVRRELEPLMIELIALSLQGKQVHWNVVGPNFRPLHAQLDEIVDDARNWSDVLAERLVAVGVYPDGQPGTIAREHGLEPLPAGAIEDRQVIELMSERVGAVGDRARDSMQRLEVDLASQDLVIEIVQGLDKHLWMLRAQSTS